MRKYGRGTNHPASWPKGLGKQGTDWRTRWLADAERRGVVLRRGRAAAIQAGRRKLVDWEKHRGETIGHVYMTSRQNLRERAMWDVANGFARWTYEAHAIRVFLDWFDVPPDDMTPDMPVSVLCRYGLPDGLAIELRRLGMTTVREACHIRGYELAGQVTTDARREVDSALRERAWRRADPTA